MKIEIYLVLSCPMDDFRKAAKNGCTSEKIVYHCNSDAMWATNTKEEAINDCRKHNRLGYNSTIYFTLPINLYCK